MTKKTTLCVLVLVITGMLCAPAAAELYNEGDWNFFIVDDTLARTDVKINGHGDRDAGEIQNIHVPASLDRVSVQFDVTWGPDTKLTITREYTDMLRKKYPNMEPVIYAHGCVDTYDVDSGGINLERRAFHNSPNGPDIIEGRLYYTMTLYEHLAKRGLLHITPGTTFEIGSEDNIDDRFVSG